MTYGRILTQRVPFRLQASSSLQELSDDIFHRVYQRAVKGLCSLSALLPKSGL